MKHQDFHTGFIRLHILHHAIEEEFFGNWMIEELTDNHAAAGDAIGIMMRETQAKVAIARLHGYSAP